MIRYLYIIILLAVSVTVSAKMSKADADAQKTEADSMYSQHHYEQAQKAYLLLLKDNPQNSELLYNVGNCYYRLKKLAHAILYYERAARINPSDDDIRHNLTLARSQSQDKFYSASDLDVVYSFNSFVNTFGSDGWAWMSVVALAVLLAAVLTVRFSDKKGIRRISFVAIFLGVVCVVLFNIFAMIQRNKYTDHSGAIVMKTTKLMSTPDTTGTNLFTLHEGTKVVLNDTTLPTWTEVNLSDGQQGWVQNNDIENI